MLAIVKALLRSAFADERENLLRSIAEKDAEIAALKGRLRETERSRHEIVERVRYFIETASHELGEVGPTEGRDLQDLGHVLPYVLTGRRHWTDPVMAQAEVRAMERARSLTEAHGFSLPVDRAAAVAALLTLAPSILNPQLSMPLQGLRNQFPK